SIVRANVPALRRAAAHCALARTSCRLEACTTGGAASLVSIPGVRGEHAGAVGDVVATSEHCFNLKAPSIVRANVPALRRAAAHCALARVGCRLEACTTGGAASLISIPGVRGDDAGAVGDVVATSEHCFNLKA